MSRLESVNNPRFTIVEETELTALSAELLAVPLNLRKEAIENFDKEFRIEDMKARLEAKSPSVNPDMVDFLANANLLVQEGEFELAQNCFRSVLKLESSNEIAIRGLANCATALHQHEEAIRILTTLVEKHKTSDNYRLLGHQLYELSFDQDAINAYMQSLSLGLFDGEELFTVYKNLGNIFLRQGDADGAEEYYNKAYTLQPDSDVLLVNFGSLALYRGEYDKALSRFREAVTINDRNDKAWVGLAMIHREYGDSALAWANVEKALDLKPDNSSAVRLVTDWAMRDNEMERAIVLIEKYLSLHPEDAQIIMWQAKFLYFSGQLPAALAEIEKALRLEPNIDGGLEVLTVVKSEIQNREQKS